MYEFTEAMGEISGFGGAYEQACRAMLKGGLEWLDAHPDEDPQFHGYKCVYGIIVEDNDAAKALSKAVLAPVSDATGAMHQAVLNHCMLIRKKGWDWYAEQMCRPPLEREAPDA